MRSGGVIINITDAGAGRTWTGFPAYTVSKAGLETLTRVLARALAPAIRVNAIAPGLILPAEEMDESEWLRLIKQLPLQAQGSTSAIVQAVKFLVENEYITGQILAVDGGYQLL